MKQVFEYKPYSSWEKIATLLLIALCVYLSATRNYYGGWVFFILPLLLFIHRLMVKIVIEEDQFYLTGIFGRYHKVKVGDVREVQLFSSGKMGIRHAKGIFFIEPKNQRVLAEALQKINTSIQIVIKN